MDFHSTKCCGIKEIDGLAHVYDPSLMMAKFCQSQIDIGVNFYAGSTHKGKLYNNYLFTAAVYPVATTKNRGTRLVDRDMWYPYGHWFADFIRANKLGTIVESSSRVNTAFHPDHEVKVWVWETDHQAILAWWKQNKSKLELFEARAKLCREKYEADLYGETYAKKIPALENELKKLEEKFA